MLYFRITILSLLFLISFASCDKEKAKDINMTIASKRVHFPENEIIPRYIVKLEVGEEWEMFHNTIVGFDYQEGYEYVVNVKVIHISNPLMDASSKEYKLNYIVSCEEKESEGIPDWWFNKGSD